MVAIAIFSADPSERGWLFRKGYPAWCRYAVIQSAIFNYLIGCNWRSKLVLFVGHHVVLRHVLRQLLNIDIEQVGKAPSAQVAVAYEVGGLFTAPAGVFELQAVHESTKPPMVLVLRADRRLGTLSGYRFFDTLQIGVDRR
jgi:hypothetical protein